jgi:hypothetical protein
VRLKPLPNAEPRERGELTFFANKIFEESRLRTFVYFAPKMLKAIDVFHGRPVVVDFTGFLYARDCTIRWLC